MKTSRNEPCPCGSGKKYKKCCLDQDVLDSRGARKIEDDHIALLDNIPADVWHDETGDPYMDEIYERFEDADFDEQVALFEEVLHRDETDAEDLFGLIDMLQQTCTDNTRRRQFNRCLTELRRLRPDCWKEDGAFYVYSLLTNAFALQETVDVREHFLQISRRPDRNIDVYCNLVDLLAYHGCHEILTEGLRLALPRIREASNVMSWVGGEMASHLVDCEILNWVNAGKTEAEFDELHNAATDILPKIDSENLRIYAEHLAGRQWVSPAALLDGRNRIDLEQLSFLTAAFAGHLQREGRASGVTGMLAGREAHRYLSRRQAGELKKPKGRGTFGKGRAGLETEVPVHPLCPDPGTLDRYIADQWHLLTSAYHSVAALMQYLPDWLAFLEQQEILTPDQSAKGLCSSARLIETLVQILEKGTEDPTLAPALRAAWAQ